MFIRAYLRASTEDQFADRAKEMLEQFALERGHKIASYYRENISGTKIERPELGRLLMDSHRNDILLVEQIDRLTRLSNSDWITLKKQIEHHELRIVSLDIPTSWQALTDKDPARNDPVTQAVITAINNMLIDLMAAMSHKDWLSRRMRQKQGIERAHKLGKYRGRQADPERHKKVLYYRHIKKLSIRETADATGYSPSQICRIQALYKKEGNTDTPSCDDYLPTSLYLKDET
ncbi:resolvase [Salmonella enterica subsp. enterica serovar Offa]|nr:resolvase [Salmonella enterica subsp. enterica serovar Offa]